MAKKFISERKTAKAPLVLYGRHAVAAALANTGRSVAKLLCTKENAAEFQD